MTALACGHYSWGAGWVLPTVPSTPAPTVGYEHPAPAQPWEAGEEWLVAIAGFPSGAVRGVLWGARIEQLEIRDRRVGPNTVTVVAPTTPQIMRLVGSSTGETDLAGRPLYDITQAVSWELLVGSSMDGMVRWRFVVRDPVSVSGGELRITGVGIVGGLTADRVIGAPTRLNLLGTIGSMESLTGWSTVGDAAMVLDDDSVEGEKCIGVTGTPGEAWIEARVTYTQPDVPWGRQAIAAQAWCKLPAAGDIEDYGLVTVAIYEGGREWWPDPTRGDPLAGVVEAQMVRGRWMPDPVVGMGMLPPPPYNAEVVVRLHPTDPVNPTFYDGVKIIREENTSTVTKKDLTAHVVKLFDHAQRGRDKSSWGVTVVEGAPTGVKERGMWLHADGQSLPEALEAICGRDKGPEIWDEAGFGRVVVAAKRRGSVRPDVVIQPWDVLALPGWQVDPGAQRTAIRGVSHVGTVWGGADVGSIDRAAAGGQIIDATVTGPAGQTPKQLQAWTDEQLATLKVLPATTTVRVRWPVGMRLAVGDSVLVGLADGAAGHLGMLRVTAWKPDFARRFVELDLGTDPGGS